MGLPVFWRFEGDNFDNFDCILLDIAEVDMVFLEVLRLARIAVIIRNREGGLVAAWTVPHTVVADLQGRPLYVVASMILGSDFCIYYITTLYASKHSGEYLVMLKFAHIHRNGMGFFIHLKASI